MGRHVVRAIARLGARMRVAVRRPELAGHLQPLGDVGQIVAVQANVRFPGSLIAAAVGADAMVNLVGILYPKAADASTRSMRRAPSRREGGARRRRPRARACLGHRRR